MLECSYLLTPPTSHPLTHGIPDGSWAGLRAHVLLPPHVAPIL